jgi:prolycopene isomerase
MTLPSQPVAAHSRQLPENNDVVVIGAGLGGLVCALELARNGFKVCVLEQHHLPGGYAQAFRRKGYHFDVSLHHAGGFDPGGMTHGVLGDLGVLGKLHLHRRERLFTAHYPDFSIAMPNDVEGGARELCGLCPAEAGKLVALLEHLRLLKYHVIGPWLDPEFALPVEQTLALRHVGDTLGTVFRSFVSDPRLLAVLGQLWMYIGLPPSQSCATFSSCVFGSAFTEGSYHIVGGGEALAAAMVERLRELGSECVNRAQVARIGLEGGAVSHVELTDGRQVAARTVVSNANPYQTFFDLIPGEEVSRVFRHRLSQMKSSLSMVSTYLGLDCRPSDLGMTGGNSFFCHSLDHDEAYARCLNREFDRTDWCLTNYEKADEAMAPPGGGVVSIAELTPAADWLEMDKGSYKENKEKLKDRLLAKYAQRFPGLTEHVAVHEFATPRTMVRYTGNHLGAVYGLAQTIDQAGSRRLRNKTPIKGLYLTGAWTWAGGGYEGAMMTGIQTAASVFQDRNAPQPAPRTRRIARPDELPRLPALSADHHLRITAYGAGLDPLAAGRLSATLRYLDRGRVEAIERVCKEAAKESWLALYVVNVYRITIDRFLPIRYPATLDVLTDFRKVSSHRAAFDQRLVLADSGQTVLDAVVEVLFLDRSKQLVPVPEGFATREARRQEAPAARPELRSTLAPPGRAEAILRPVPFGQAGHFVHSSRHRVYYEDTDAQNIAYHVTYCRFCEKALVDFFAPALAGGEWPAGGAPRILRYDIRYLKSATLGDRVEVRTGTRRIDDRRFILDQRVVMEHNGDVLCDAMTEVEFPDSESLRPAVALLSRIASGR